MLADIIIEQARQRNPRAADPYPVGLKILDLAMTENHPMGGLRLCVSPYLTWSRDVLGYVPLLRSVGLAQHSHLCAMFRDTTDAELFRLAFIQWWKQ